MIAQEKIKKSTCYKKNTCTKNEHVVLFVNNLKRFRTLIEKDIPKDKIEEFFTQKTRQ